MIDSIICMERMFYKTKGVFTRLRDRIESLTMIVFTRDVRYALYNGLLILAVCNLLLCMFTLKTLIALSFFLFALKQYAMFRVKMILKNGLISYLSYNLQVMLLRRSIFDFLCDMWFFPKLSLYLKAIFGPLIMKPDPEHAAKELAILPENSKKIFFTKGIVYVLPKSLKRIFLPTSATIYNKVYNVLQRKRKM